MSPTSQFAEMPDNILEILNDKSFIVPSLTEVEKHQLQKKKVALYNKNKYANNPKYTEYKKEQANIKYKKMRQLYEENKNKSKD